MRPAERTGTDSRGEGRGHGRGHSIDHSIDHSVGHSDDDFLIHDPRPIPAHLYGEWRAESRGAPSEPEREEGETGTAARAA